MSSLGSVIGGVVSGIVTMGVEMLATMAISYIFNKVMDGIHAHENKIKAGQEAQQ